MRVKLNDLRPGALLARRGAKPYEIGPDQFAYDTVKVVTFAEDGTHIATGWGVETEVPAEAVEVTTTPPRVLMSWDVESQTWAILIDTGGAPNSRLNVALNDAELFDGVTDPDD